MREERTHKKRKKTSQCGVHVGAHCSRLFCDKGLERVTFSAFPHPSSVSILEADEGAIQTLLKVHPQNAGVTPQQIIPREKNPKQDEDTMAAAQVNDVS